jgi:hypothetical protein
VPAGLASALTSFVKKAALLTRAADGMQPPGNVAAAGQRISAVAAAFFPAAVRKLTDRLCTQLADTVKSASLHFQPQYSPGSSSSSSSLAAASLALLAVVLARSLVQLADAIEAAGPQLLFNSLLANPLYGLIWVKGRPGSIKFWEAAPAGTQQQHSPELQWHYWQLPVLHSAQRLVSALGRLGLAPTAWSTAASSSSTTHWSQQ